MIASPRTTPAPGMSFVVPPALEASMPPEQRGTTRDGVRLLVVQPCCLAHRRFHDLPQLLEPGDLVVVNTSATLAAALRGHREDGRPALVHISGWLEPSSWILEVRRGDNGGPDLELGRGEVLALPGSVRVTLQAPYPDGSSARSRLWVATVAPATELVGYLQAHGRPIAYGHLAAGLPLSAHQTVYADVPGSAEMPSAGRPFTADLLVRLMAAGITVAPLILHAGVSSPELHEPPAPERYSVPESTARLVAATRSSGRRVVAVGTTAVRALETVAGAGGIRGDEGWTDLVLGPERPARVVDGLITGLHRPESSHLALLQAVSGRQMVEAAYGSALESGYLWHEFGDSMLFLP